MDDRKADAVAHLAVARTQNTGERLFLGELQKDKGGRPVRPLFAMAISRSLGFVPELGQPFTIPVRAFGDSGDSNEIKWNYDVEYRKKSGKR